MSDSSKINKQKAAPEKAQVVIPDIQSVVLNSTEFNIIAVDTYYRLIYFNTTSERFSFLFGKENFEIGMHFLPDDDTEFWKNLYDRGLNGETFQLQKPYKLKGKIEIDLLNVSPIINTQGEVDGCILYGKNVTELMIAQKALKINEEKFRSIFEQNSLGVMITYKSGGSNINKSLHKMWGYTEEEINQMVLSQITHPDDLPFSLENLKKLEKGEIEFFTQEKRYIRKDQTMMWGKVTVTPIYDDQKNYTANLSVIQDISEEKEIEEALRVSEHNFKMLFEASPLGIVIREPGAQQFKQVNHKFCEIFGYSMEEAPLINREELIMYEDKDALARNMEMLMSGQISSYRMEKKYRRKNGEIFWAVATRALVKIQNKLFFIGTVEDINKQKQTEHALSGSEAKIRAIFNSTQDKIFAIDRKYRLIDFNKAAELVFPTLFDVQHLAPGVIMLAQGPKLREMWMEYYERALAGESFQLTKNYFFDNQNRTDLVTFHPIKDERGKIIGVTLYGKEITELQLAEQKRGQLLEELAEVNKELKEFAYIVSHDLKAPLRNIISISDWLSADYSDKIDQKGKYQLQMLNNRVRRMHEFINGIFEYTKLGRMNETKELIDLNETLNNVKEILGVQPNVEIQLKNTLPKIYGEKIKLEQVFQNLISNAIKYNDKETCIIEIDYKDIETHYLFCIKDNGPGIEERNYEKIFKIFQTLQPKDDFESTGIGLTIVKRILQLHGGQIQVKSEIGKGSTFEFTIEK